MLVEQLDQVVNASRGRNSVLLAETRWPPSFTGSLAACPEAVRKDEINIRGACLVGNTGKNGRWGKEKPEVRVAIAVFWDDRKNVLGATEE